MAETKAKRGRPPKSVNTTPKKVEEKQNSNQDDIIKQLMAQIEEQNKKMAEMQKQINNQPQTPTIIQQTNNGLSGKKVKVINMMHNTLNIATEPRGMGRVYTFKGYGDVKFIKYDDLVDIISSYPRTMESGLAYICDKEVVESLGLADDYQKLFNKETMDRVIKLRDESDLELFLGMDIKLQESTAKKIAERINTNEKVDYNYINTIKEKTGIDIEEIVKDLKDLSRTPNDDEE